MNQTTAGLFTKNLYESNTQEEWDYLLGPVNYHYHFGFPGESSNIFENAIHQNVFPFIANNSRVLDCGCGWGAPAEMLVEQKKCKVTSVTNSFSQFKFLKEKRKNIKVINTDLNLFKPSKNYDVALFYESLSHIEEQVNLLKAISNVTDNILIIDHTDKNKKHSKDFHGNNPYPSYFYKEWHMHFQTIETTCKKLTDLNFTIQYCEDLGINHIIPTSLYWKSRLINMNTSYGQIKLLNIDVNFMLENFKAASEETGLVLIYASKNL
jgi:cyclopropane fatty-acyl-phospholipid synthase-like methyltransferase